MRQRSFTAFVILLLGFLTSQSAAAQNIDGLNVQVHGYVTQAFLYSTNNNWNTTNSSLGSVAWTEAVSNVISSPGPRLRLGAQARYFRLGALGKNVTLDWAEGDFKVDERFGFRAGKVKTPIGLWNDTQDIDPAHLWILLPQSVYPIASRSTTLAHFGGVIYGLVPLKQSFGRLEYQAYGGVRKVTANDGYLNQFRDIGMELPNGLTGTTYGGELKWKVPLRGLELGASEGSEAPLVGAVLYHSLPGTIQTCPFNAPRFFVRYENTKLMLAAEHSRTAPHGTFHISGLAPIYSSANQQSYYVMSSYKLAHRFTGGAYFSSVFDLKVASSSARYQKDWVVSGRYDLNSYVYLKAEEHFINGTLTGYTLSSNPAGLKPKTSLTLVNVGVSF